MENPVVARLLGARGLAQAPEYSLKRLLPPTLGGLDQAAEILADAILGRRRILIVGDYDADGATGTTLAVRALAAMGAVDVQWRVPDRFRHGYGLTPQLVSELADLRPDVLVTVDQGISSIDGVAAARKLGIRVVITDHHLPGSGLPAADAIINPNLPGDPFPSRNLAGVGVMFYALTAVRAHLRGKSAFPGKREPRLDQFLDLVALGTVADLVPLDENNRNLVYHGLSRIASGNCLPGIRALLEISGRNASNVKASDLGYAVAPRLNAAGRLEDMGIGIRCLLADEEAGARKLAQRLDNLNLERRQIEAGMLAQAERQATAALDRVDTGFKGLCVYDEGWHQGVVGLVASRMADRLQRPVIAFAPADEGSTELKGSGRSPAGAHMRDMLVEIANRHPGLLGRYGGHARAAGLSLRLEDLEAFRDAFADAAERLDFGTGGVLTDGELAASELNLDTAIALENCGPWGQGWPEPLFDGRFRVLGRRVVGQDHLKLVLDSGADDHAVDAIAFRAGRLARGELPDPLHVTYRLEANRWLGKVRPQLVIEHLVEAIDP